MAQKARDSRLEKRTNRLSKAKLGERYFKVLGNGVALCYRRTSDSYGTWSVRLVLADGRYRLEALGAADDHVEANGQNVFSFEQAQDKALARHRELQRAGGIVKGPLTVAEAAAHYMEWFRPQPQVGIDHTGQYRRAHASQVGRYASSGTDDQGHQGMGERPRDEARKKARQVGCCRCLS